MKEIVRDDLAALKAPRDKVTIARFRDPHHRLARMTAAGLRQHEIVARSGYSVERVNTIQADPAFKELVAKYRLKVEEAFVDGVEEFYSLATSNMLKAERQIAEKLDESDEVGELLPTKDLLAISRDAADRFGFHKKQTNVNVNVDFAAQLERAIARSGKTAIAETVHASPPQQGEQIDAQVNSLTGPLSSAPHPFRRRA